jgi:membrane-associated PAP2 superfamily phosphatase
LPHALIPIVLAVLGTICQYTGLDEWLIQPFFDASSQTWPYDGNWWVAGLIHKGGRDFVAVALSSILIAVVVSFFHAPLERFRKDLTYLLVAALSGILIVSLIKNTTHIYIPSDLTVFGGTMPHIRLFDPVPPGLPIGHAFPAGHSSGAFALIGAYFLFTVRGSRWRFPALGACLALGFTFGLAQQIRGKHFFSHDLFSLAICWGAALLVLYAFRLPQTLPLQLSPEPERKESNS